MLSNFFKYVPKSLTYTAPQNFSKIVRALRNASKVSYKAAKSYTATDIKKLKQYLDEESTANMTKAINRQAMKDEEFKLFLESYKKKNPDCPKIIDLSHYAKDQENLRTMEDLR